jgi:hypothetical protein
LAVLVLHRGEAVSSDRLIDEIWGEQPPASANKLIHGVAPPGTRPRDLRSSYITLRVYEWRPRWIADA